MCACQKKDQLSSHNIKPLRLNYLEFFFLALEDTLYEHFNPNPHQHGGDSKGLVCSFPEEISELMEGSVPVAVDAWLCSPVDHL